MKKERKIPQLHNPGLPDDSPDLSESERSQRIAERTRFEMELAAQNADDDNDADKIIEFKMLAGLMAMFRALTLTRRLADDAQQPVAANEAPAILSSMERMKRWLSRTADKDDRVRIKVRSQQKRSAKTPEWVAPVVVTLPNYKNRPTYAVRRAGLGEMRATQAANFVPSAVAPTAPSPGIEVAIFGGDD